MWKDNSLAYAGRAIRASRECEVELAEKVSGRGVIGGGSEALSVGEWDDKENGEDGKREGERGGRHDICVCEGRQRQTYDEFEGDVC